MNEIEILQSQLATERLHFTEVARSCMVALETGRFAGTDFAQACADYLAFAITRLTWKSTVLPRADASGADWRQLLRLFAEASEQHFAALEACRKRNLSVSEWRALAKIDADSIFTERARYGRVMATAP